MLLEKLGVVMSEVDRKVLVALVARKLWEFLEGFSNTNAQSIKLVLNLDSKEFRNYLLDVLPEACQLIKEHKGVK